MRFKVEHRVGVPASAAAVWNVLSDLPRWNEWNSLYQEIHGLLRIGQQLAIGECFPGQPDRVIRPTVVDWVPNEQILWALSESNSILSNGEVYDGFLGRRVGKARRRWLREGFERLNADIVARVQAVAEGRATAEGDRG